MEAVVTSLPFLWILQKLAEIRKTKSHVLCSPHIPYVILAIT